MNIADNTLSKVKEYLVKELKPHTLILFGSSVKGYFREDSDIDETCSFYQVKDKTEKKRGRVARPVFFTMQE